VFDSEFLADTVQFAALAAKLAESFSSEIDGPQAAEGLTDLLAAVRLGELLTCQLIERVDRTGEFAADGSASTVAYVRGISGERSSWASRRVQLGRALADRLPETAESWQRGDLGLDHASVIYQATTKLDDDLTADVESALAGAAEHLNPTELSALAEMVRAQAAPDAAADDAETRRLSQRFSLSQTLDGRWRLDGWLDSEAGMIVSAAIDEFTRKRAPDLEPGADPIGLRRAEALVQIAKHASAHAEDCNGQASSRHTTIVTMTMQDLQSGQGVAQVQGGTTITAAAARRLACDGKIIPVVLGGASEILDFGREKRLATPGQHRYLGLRDGGCLWPKCDRPPARTEAHHRVHSIDGGPTSHENLDSFCTFHHHLVHEGGWKYTVTKNGDGTDTLRFTPPGGGISRTKIRRSRPPKKTFARSFRHAAQQMRT
jgi:hypothetical protein